MMKNSFESNCFILGKNLLYLLAMYKILQREKETLFIDDTNDCRDCSSAFFVVFVLNYIELNLQMKQESENNNQEGITKN